MRLVPYGKDVRFPKLGEHFSAYDIVSEQQTENLMQTFVQSRWGFPITLYFESTPAEKESVLSVPLPVKEMHSIKKNMYLSPEGVQREYIPAYVLQIENETMLEQAFEEFFYVAEQNCLFALANEPSLFYKGYSLTTTSDTVEILTAYYDGQGAIFMTCSKEDL